MWAQARAGRIPHVQLGRYRRFLLGRPLVQRRERVARLRAAAVVLEQQNFGIVMSAGAVSRASRGLAW